MKNTHRKMATTLERYIKKLLEKLGVEWESYDKNI